MADTSQQELSEPHTNGAMDGLTEEEKSKIRPADIDADMREMERRKRVEMMMNSRLFREELERIIETQMKDGAGPSGLLQQISDMMGAQGARFNGNVFKNSNCVVPINDIRGVESMGYAKGEKLLRCKLAAVFRLLDLYGWTQNVGGQMTARLNQDQEHFLVNPFGLLYHEITASSLIKVDMQGSVVEQGTTNFGIHLTGFQLHSTIHAARPDIKCIVHISTPSVTAISSLKCGLLPIGQESIVIGEVSTHHYVGGMLDPEEREKITRNLGPINKVMLLTNRGALCCGETVEEAFYNVYNTVLACETQLKLMPAGLDNLNLISEESKKTIFEASRKPPIPQQHITAPESTVITEKLEKRWRIGGTEFEALMRMLDNAGFRTGYIYRNPLVKGEPPKPRNDVEVPPAVSSLGYLLEEEELYKQGLWKGGRKGTDRSRWLNSPNVYQKVEILETGTPDPKKITKWVSDGSPTHSSTPVKIDGALQFVPKNTNPKEFKQIQQQIKDYRRADKISAGPQSHILEGVTWEEAKKMQDATISGTGEQVVLVGAASKGIIQRGFQHNAMVYKTPYAKNPFDAITDQELDQYKKEVERKQKGDPYDESQSESEALSSFNISRATHESSTAKSPIQSPVSVTSETEEESRDEPRVLRIETKQVPAPSQPEVVLSDAYATTEFLNEMRRAAIEAESDISRQDYTLSRGCCGSESSGGSIHSSWRSPELHDNLQLQVVRSFVVAERMKPAFIECSWDTTICKKPVKKINDDYKYYDKKVTDNHYNRETRFLKNYRTRIEARREFFENYEKRMLNDNFYGVQGKYSFKHFQNKYSNNVINNPNQLVSYQNHNDKTRNNDSVEKIYNSSRYQDSNDHQDKSSKENDHEKDIDESSFCENNFWEDDDCHCLSSISKNNNQEELYNCNRRGSLGDVINCINDKILPSRASLNALPVTEASDKYNLDSTNMNLIYSLTPSSETLTVCYENNNADNITNKSFDVENESNEWMMIEEINNEKTYSSHNSSLENICQDDSIDNNSIVDFNDKCSNNGSDILELPTGTILELEDFLGVSFSEEMNTSVNQILAELDVNQVYVEAANIVDQIIEDVSRLTSNLNLPSKNTVPVDNFNFIVINELVHHVLETNDNTEEKIIVSTPKINSEIDNQNCTKESIILQDLQNNNKSVVNDISEINNNNNVITTDSGTCIECHCSETLIKNNNESCNVIDQNENNNTDVDENLNVRVIKENHSQNNRPLSDEIILEFCSITNRSNQNDTIKLNFQIEKSQCEDREYLLNKTSKISRKRKHCEVEYADREMNRSVLGYERNLELSNNFQKNFQYGLKSMKQYCFSKGLIPIIDDKSMILNENIETNDHCFDHYNDHQYEDLSPITEETSSNESLNEETNIFIDTCSECLLKTCNSNETMIISFIEKENINISGEESNKSTDYYTCKDESSEYNTSIERPSSCSDNHFQDTIDQVSVSSDTTYVICKDFVGSPESSDSNNCIISINNKEISVEEKNDSDIKENIQLVLAKSSSPVLVENNVEVFKNFDDTIPKRENTVNGDHSDAHHSTFSQSSKEGSMSQDVSVSEESPKKEKKKKKGLRTPSFLKKKKEKKKSVEA
ncbi:hypothetical protein M0802_011561 [Mischocyttarus mexicanus]|nr:hypothetical protein M0802_011561 [Mischocyttarus mexicanus]